MDLAQPNHIQAMLDDVGYTLEDLFQDIPQPIQRGLDIPEGEPDHRVEDDIQNTLANNATLQDQTAFLGGGSYDHWLPPETRFMATRGELLTAYTPYQAEINQGLLQSLFEFQTLTARLLELDVANTGMYDGASAAGEAVLMAIRTTRDRHRILVPEHVPHQRRSILENYVDGAQGTLETLPTSPQGTTELNALEDAIDEDTACVHIETPNAYGRIEPLDEIAQITHEAGARLTVNVPEVTSLGLVHGPGHYGADIATSEGQPLALPPSYGGPALGLFAVDDSHLRRMPGRLVGHTHDANDEDAYCMTLQTREQHIRRSRATSNICTNQSFLAVLFTTTLAAYGETGFRNLAQANADNGHALATRLAEAGARVPYHDTPGYNEVLYEPPIEAEAFREKAREHGIDPGVPAKRLMRNGTDGLIACATETTTPGDIDALADLVQEVA